MRITMIGTGYVGLVSGACFSDFGDDVICVDRDPTKIETLGKGQVPIYEPGLEALIARNVEAGRLSFTGDLKTAMEGAQAIFIAVGTPTRRGDGHADLTYVMAAAEEIAVNLTYRKKWRMNLTEEYESGLGLDLIPMLEGTVGTVYRRVGGGVTVRGGLNLPDDYGPMRIDDVASAIRAAT